MSMTDHERYLFDLQGFLVVRDALTPDQVEELDRAFTAKMADGAAPDQQSRRLGATLKWGKAYRDLIDNPRITPYLEELLGAQFRLDHDYADLIRSGHSPIGAWLHGGGTPFDPSQFYRFADGRPRCGLSVVAYNLHDVHPGDGGFACVPGSHKANYPLPHDWHNLDHPQPCVLAVPAPAGSAVIFTEALTHGTLPWKGRGERHTVFFKYSPGAISWAATYYNPDDYDDLTARQRATLESPNARYKGRPTAPKP
jgi:hypothetical protein